MEYTKKYVADIHRPNTDKMLGRIQANTKQELRDEVREHCYNWGHFGRVLVSRAVGYGEKDFEEFCMNI